MFQYKKSSQLPPVLIETVFIATTCSNRNNLCRFLFKNGHQIALLIYFQDMVFPVDPLPPRKKQDRIRRITLVGIETVLIVTTCSNGNSLHSYHMFQYKHSLQLPHVLMETVFIVTTYSNGNNLHSYHMFQQKQSLQLPHVPIERVFIVSTCSNRNSLCSYQMFQQKQSSQLPHFPIETIFVDSLSKMVTRQHY